MRMSPPCIRTGGLKNTRENLIPKKNWYPFNCKNIIYFLDNYRTKGLYYLSLYQSYNKYRNSRTVFPYILAVDIPNSS